MWQRLGRSCRVAVCVCVCQCLFVPVRVKCAEESEVFKEYPEGEARACVAGRYAGCEPNEGFGFQSVYTPAGVAAKKFGERLNEAYRVENYDTVAIAEGYHPLAGAPGYNMYYLWTMAGDQGRGLISSMDPAHAWVKNA